MPSCSNRPHSWNPCILAGRGLVGSSGFPTRCSCSGPWPSWSRSSSSSRSTTSCRRSTPSCATFPSSATSVTSSKPVGPELRQYIVTDNDEERPFSPRPAPLGLRLVQETKQPTSVSARTTISNSRTELPHHQALALFPSPPPVEGQPGYDPELQDSLRQGCSANSAGAQKAFQPRLHRQCLRP